MPLLLLFCCWVGLFFAFCARLQFRTGSVPWGRELAAVLSFQVVVVWPFGLYLYLVHPDWSWMYTRPDAARLSVLLAILLLLGYLAALLIGYGAGWVLIRNQRERYLSYAFAAVALVGMLVSVLGRHALAAYGTWADYHDGHTRPLPQVKLFWVLLVCAAGLAGSAIAVGWTLWSQGRRTGQGGTVSLPLDLSPTGETSLPAAGSAASDETSLPPAPSGETSGVS